MNKIHIGILGAGKIGTAIYNLLVASGSGYDVKAFSGKSLQITVADQNKLNNINVCDFQSLAIGEDNEFDKFVKDKTLIINALPFQYNLLIYKTCLEYNIPYFDLSEEEIQIETDFNGKEIIIFGILITLIPKLIPMIPSLNFFSNWNAVCFWLLIGWLLSFYSKKNKRLN